MVTWGWRERTSLLAQAKTLTLLGLACRQGKSPHHSTSLLGTPWAQLRAGGTLCSLHEGTVNHRADPSYGATPWYSPQSLLSGLDCCLVPAAAARFLLLCSFQYSRQRRSWKWMKRHITEAWKRHTNSSTLILAGAEKRQAENREARPPPAQPSAHTRASGQGPPGWLHRALEASSFPPATISTFCHSLSSGQALPFPFSL